jgi:hypothetical protein
MNLVEQNGAVPKLISAHHNLFVNHRARLPNIGPGAELEFVNNLVYNWEQRATDIAGMAKVSIIGNHYLDGPMNTSMDASPIRHGVWIRTGQTDMQVYVKNNIGFGRQTNSGNEWNIVDDNGTGEQYRVMAPPIALSGITENNVEELSDIILNYAGAILPSRDAVDERLLDDVRNKTGGNISSQDDVGGWPDLNGGTPPTDRDDDGMPDFWEEENGFNPDDPADASWDNDQDGYSNIEEYINSLIPPRS